MRVVIPQISWHGRSPVLSVDFDPSGKAEQGYYRLATGGSDNLLLIWHLANPQSTKPTLTCVAELNRHMKAVNVCRFSPCGNFIAAGDDDAYILIWKHEKNEDVSKKNENETWRVEKVLRRHLEDVSDLNWSSDGSFLVSGSVDNATMLWDVKKGTVLQRWSEREHVGFVQGVAYDPLGEVTASMCIDKKLRLFSNETGEVISRTYMYPPAWLGASENEDESSESEEDSKPPPKKSGTTLNRLFHGDTLKTFCRRLNYSPRGELLMVPGGLLPQIEKKLEGSTPSKAGTQSSPDEDTKDKQSQRADPEKNNAVIIFSRNCWTSPCAIIPTGASYSIAVRFNPVHYEKERQPYAYDPGFLNSNKRAERMVTCIGRLRPPSPKKGPVLLMKPYRLVYAVATNESIIIGDTGSIEPLACVRNIHCTRMTDISWSPDGLVMIASSTDGYCSILTFEKGELGAELGGNTMPNLTGHTFSVVSSEPVPANKEASKEVKEKELKESKVKLEKEQPSKLIKPPKAEKNSTEMKTSAKAPLFSSSTPKKTAAVTPKKTGGVTPKKTGGVTPKKTGGAAPKKTGGVTPKKTGGAAPKKAVAATPMKPTFLDNWLKQTPKSQPELCRVQLTTLLSTSGTTKHSRASVSSLNDFPVTKSSSVTINYGNGSTLDTAARSFEKELQRVPLLKLTRCDDKIVNTTVTNSFPEAASSVSLTHNQKRPDIKKEDEDSEAIPIETDSDSEFSYS